MDSDAQSFVEYAASDRVATITLNRPDKLNAVSDEVVRQLAEAFRRFDLDPEAEVAILNGKGRAFCSGADVRQRQLRSRDEFEKLGGPQGWGTNSADLFTRAVNWKPIITAVHGYVLGLGLGLMLESDLIVAAEGTRMQLTETPRGLGASRYWALFQYRAAGAFGDEVALTGRFFTAEEAFEAGIVNRLAPEGKHVEVAHELAQQIAKNPPLSVRTTVRTRRWYMQRLIREAQFMAEPFKLYLTEDFQEAARAFAEKRPPGRFKGR
ncbi:MAG TPA: enoyl-CoA hydratase/isomerase family protein [Stellaceae bacterium]